MVPGFREQRDLCCLVGRANSKIGDFVTLRRFILVTCVACVIVLLGVLYGVAIQGPNGDATQHNQADPVCQGGTNVQALAQLLAQNNIHGLPTGFAFWNDSSDITCFEATDSAGVEYKLVRVTFRVEALGDRRYAFIFDAAGNCVLHLDDMELFRHGGMLDLTRDGRIEKISTSVRASTARQEELLGIGQMGLQIWRLELPSARILLDVRYAWLTKKEPNDFVDVTVRYNERDDGWHIDLRGSSSGMLASFLWSNDDQRFAALEVDLKYVKVLYPSDEDEVRHCTFHPKIPLEPDRSCPVCGWTP